MDEVKLFEELLPPPPPDVPRMRAAARARLTAATSAPLVPPARRRRSTVVAGAAAAALVATGTGYGLAAAQHGSGPGTATRGGSSPLPGTTAGLTAVHGCPGKYITAGTLERVSGTRLILQPANDQDHQNRTWRAQPVTVATSTSTVITRPASGTVSDITDGSHVVVQGTWSGGRFAATEVGIEEALPAPSSFGPHLPHRLPKLFNKRGLVSPMAMGPPMARGTVVDAHDGSFTVVTDNILGGRTRIQVTTSSSTKVVTKTSATVSQLDTGANIVAVGQLGPHGVLTASIVTEPSVVGIVLAGGPAKIRPSSCSADAITTAATWPAADR